MTKGLQELRAKYLGELQRWGETVIVELDIENHGYAKAKGQVEEGELVVGLWYRFYGRWTRHYRYGDQFQFQTFVATEALDEDGLIRYLVQAPNIGKVTARKLVKLYGSDAVRKLRMEPEVCAEQVCIRSFKLEGAQKAAEFLEQEKDLEETTVELLGLLAGKGFPRNLVKKCIRKWGNKAAKVVHADPYGLMRFKGVGFARADELYLRLGHDPDAIKRQGLCAWYACASDTEGDTWLGGNTVHSELLKKIGATKVRPREAVEWAIGAGILELYRDSNHRRRLDALAAWFADHERSEAEFKIAELAAQMGEYGASEWPCASTLDISEHQREELYKALYGRLALFTGSPGTGKTYSAARLIRALIDRHGQDEVAVVAPTGKAAVRISEALQEYGISLRARTVHSFLEVGQVDEDDSEGFAFKRGPGAPVDQRWVICDESSMLDTWLLSKLLSALRMDGHLLLVGDVNQLPPVGHGAPLRDLITAGVPRGELTEIRRNSGAIVRTCAAIRDEKPWNLPGKLALEEGGNLILRTMNSPQDSAEEIVRALLRIRAGGQLDPVWDCQVVVAVNEKSPLSRKVLNKRLQEELNGANRPERDAAFWKQDKVVCLKNSFFPAVLDLMEEEDEEGEIVVQEGTDGGPQFYVANGELGRVIEDQQTKTIVDFASPHRTVLVPKGEGGTDRLDLGYALSVHKSQGSEWPIVLVALDDYGGALMVCDRSWLYTSISRAKQACILIGRESTAREMVGRVKIRGRKTFLVERFATAARALEEKRELNAPKEEVIEDESTRRDATEEEPAEGVHSAHG